jgi:hypothetical protein
MADWSPQSDLVGLEIILIVGIISGDDDRDNASDGGSCFAHVLILCLKVMSAVLGETENVHHASIIDYVAHNSRYLELRGHSDIEKH